MIFQSFTGKTFLFEDSQRKKVPVPMHNYCFFLHNRTQQAVLLLLLVMMMIMFSLFSLFSCLFLSTNNKNNEVQRIFSAFLTCFSLSSHRLLLLLPVPLPHSLPHKSVPVELFLANFP
jgi:hypothetical protein